MSDIIANPHLERDMSDNFVCVLYFRDRNDIELRTNGTDPHSIWQILDCHAFDESVLPIILDRLIANNANRGFIRLNGSTNRVFLTDTGREWAEENCRTRAGVIG
jgi:hypothetical protein